MSAKPKRGNRAGAPSRALPHAALSSLPHQGTSPVQFPGGWRRPEVLVPLLPPQVQVVSQTVRWDLSAKRTVWVYDSPGWHRRPRMRREKHPIPQVTHTPGSVPATLGFPGLEFTEESPSE